MRISFLVPHLSTGGMPQYTYWLIKEIIKNTKNEVFVIEFSKQSCLYIVQKNNIKKIIGENLITLDEGIKEHQIKKFVEIIKPDIIHLQEFPEIWLPRSICDFLYKNNRSYKIIETSHSSVFNSDNKIFFPDEFVFISDYYVPFYKKYNIPYKIIEYPIIKRDRPDRNSSLFELGLSPYHKHVLNVGLFTPRKNQKEIFEISKNLLDKKILFHFVGNMAQNFYEYWYPIISISPKNCILWRERDDVDNFYKCMDLFLFTSKGNDQDRESNPLVIKEALGWGMPILMYNLSIYNGKYDNNSNIEFLDGNIKCSCDKIMKKLNL